jgi:hypothetical protein
MCNNCDGKCNPCDCIESHPDSDFQDSGLSFDFEDFEERPDPDGYTDQDYENLLNGF